MAMPSGGIPLGEWSGSDATRELTAVILKVNEAAAAQTRTTIRLTWAIALMTFVMVVQIGLQIWITLL